MRFANHRIVVRAGIEELLLFLVVVVCLLEVAPCTTAHADSGPSTLRTATHKLDCKRGSSGLYPGTRPNQRWVPLGRNSERLVPIRWGQIEPFEPSSGGRFPGRIVESLLAMPDGGLFIGFRNAGLDQGPFSGDSPLAHDGARHCAIILSQVVARAGRALT